MSRIYKTVKGKTIDIDHVKLANENTIAVGNMKVNARGDLLGAGNQVAAGRNEVMDRVYAVDDGPVGGHSLNSRRQSQPVANDRSKQLHDLANGLISTTVEAPVAESTDPVAESAPAETPAPAPTRGSLASAVAKTTVVTQQIAPDPRKPKGPSRI